MVFKFDLIELQEVQGWAYNTDAKIWPYYKHMKPVSGCFYTLFK